jgi:invasion protein IalB
MSRTLIPAIGLGVWLAATATASAQSITAPPAQAVTPASTIAKVPMTDTADMTTATYGDWLLRCRQAPGETPSRSCEVVQSLMLQGQTAPLAQLAFGRPSPKDPLYFTAVVPPNVAFPSSVRIALDEKDPKPVEVAYTRCLPAGCFASIVVPDAALASWRAKDEPGRLIFKSGAGQETSVPMSFRGLARALDALAKEK